MSLRLTEVNFAYPKTGRGVGPITGSWSGGRWTALAGSSGSGKSTLLRLAAGLLKPQSGRIESARVSDRPGAPVGLVLQFPEHHFFCTTVFDEIAYGLRRLGVRGPSLSEAVHQALDRVGVPRKDAQRSPFQLSGGAQRLVAVAAALAVQPHLLLLDEPAAGLDPAQRSNLLQRIDEWRQESGAGIVLSTHDMDEAARWADDLWVLGQGRLLYSGPAGHGSQPFEKAAAWGIGLPTPIAVLTALRDAGHPIPTYARTSDDASKRVRELLLEATPEAPSEAEGSARHTASEPLPPTQSDVLAAPSAPVQATDKAVTSRSRLDPRTYLAFTAAIFLATLGASTWIGLAVASLGPMLWAVAARIPADALLQGLRAVRVLFVITILFHALLGTGEPLIAWGPMSLSGDGLWRGIWMASRLAVLVIGATLLTQSTSPLHLTQALDALFAPLTRVGVPTREASMIVGVGMRFVPVLAAEARRIQEAQALRTPGSGKGNVAARLRNLIPVLVPLIGSSLRRADELGDAMAARAYTPGSPRTYLYPLQASALDRLAAVGALLAGLAVALAL